MRYAAAILCVLSVTACGMGSSTPTPVDAANLPPLSGREQAILVGAEAQARQGNLAAAENDYLSAVGESQGHVEAHLALAKIYASEHQPDKERAILDKARELQPNNPGINYLLGKLDLASGQNDAALDDFNRGLTTVPGDFDLSNGAAIANDMLGRHQTAQAIYLQLIHDHKSENLADVKTNLGMSYLFSDQPRKAVAILKPESVKPGAALVTRTNPALAYDLLNKPLDAKFVMKGEGDAEARHETLERLKAYIADNSPNKTPVAVNPVVVPAKRID